MTMVMVLAQAAQLIGAKFAELFAKVPINTFAPKTSNPNVNPSIIMAIFFASGLIGYLAYVMLNLQYED